jgi:hypothetical protein
MPDKKFNTETVYRFSRHSPEYGVFVREHEEDVYVFGKPDPVITTVYTFLRGIRFKHYVRNPDPKQEGFAIIQEKRQGRFVFDVIESFKGPVHITEA